MGARFSNLSDKFTALFVTIGKGTGGALNFAVTKIGEYLDFINFALKSSEDLEKELVGGQISDALAVYSKGAGDLRLAYRQNLVRDIEKEEKELNQISSDYGDERNENERNKDIENREFKLRFLKQKLDAYATYEKELQDQDKKAAEELAAQQRIADEKAAKEKAKRDKAAAKEQERRLKELQAALADLEKKADAARLSLFDKDSFEFLEASLQDNLKDIDQFQAKLEKLAKAAGKTLGPGQLQQLNLLREAAYEEFGKKTLDLQRKKDDELFELQNDSAQKEIEAVRRKYDRRIEEAKRGSDLEKALIAARNRDIANLETKKALGNLDQREQAGVAQVERNLIPLDNDPAKFERLKQQAILDVQIEFAEKRLALLQFNGDAENTLQIEQLKTLIASLKRERATANNQKEEFSLWKLFGLDPKNAKDQKTIEGIQSTVSTLITSISQITEAELAANQARIDSLNGYISEKEGEFDGKFRLTNRGLPPMSMGSGKRLRS